MQFIINYEAKYAKSPYLDPFSGVISLNMAAVPVRPEYVLTHLLACSVPSQLRKLRGQAARGALVRTFKIPLGAQFFLLENYILLRVLLLIFDIEGAHCTKFRMYPKKIYSSHQQ